ncbi:MAG TPA: winged helix DNA-binding domain-containing protein [Micromonosporaceae bacterium]|jgi:hypothetical protein
MAGLVARRMHRQHLWGRPFASVDDAIRAFGAMQAQEFRPAMWGIGARVAGAREADVLDAFAAGTLLRTHILRPTWHFVHAADIRWMLLASAPRVHAVNAYYYRSTGVEDRVAARARTIFETILGDGQQLTRKELAVSLAEAGLPDSGVPLAYVVIRAELDGVLVSGAMRGKQPTYALLDLRAPGPAATDRDEALAELARRFFGTRGPATVKDFATWASLTLTEARRCIEMLGPEVQTDEIDGRTMHVVGAEPSARTRLPIVDLLQDYDEYVVGYSDSRDAMFRPDGPQSALVARRRPLVQDGRLIGFWRHTETDGAVTVEANTADAPDRPALDAAVQRFGEFLARETRLILS